MTTTVKTVNYTPEQTAKMVADYVAAPSAVTVEAIALALGKTVRSVVAKLSREKVYVAKEYKTKTGEKVQKKDAVADAIGAVLKMSEPEIESLTKVNKTALLKVWAIVAASVAVPKIEAEDDNEGDETDLDETE
jgi:hypothetical protein